VSKPLDLRIEYGKWRNWRKKLDVVLKQIPKKLPVPKPKPHPTKLHMYDNVNPGRIPKWAEAVAGYIGGKWPTYPKVVAGWPHAKHLSIAVSSIYDADCLDVEPGDAPINLAPEWVKRQLRLRREGKVYNSTKPVLYTSASWGPKLIAACTAAGLRYGIDYFWWSAHYDPKKGEHFCNPSCGFGIKVRAHATQFTDNAEGNDESVVSHGFFL